MTGRSITKLKVDLRPISLDNDGLLKLCSIVLKAAENDPSASVRLEISGKKESVEATTTASLINAKFPKDLRGVRLYASSRIGNREIDISINNIGDMYDYSNIEVSEEDVDWVSARTKELEDFIGDHKNYHWVFQDGLWLVMQIILLLVLYSLFVTNGFKKIDTIGLFSIISTGVGIFFWYGALVKKIFPTVVLDTGRPSNLKTVRRALAWVINIILGTILVALLGLLVRFIFHLVV